MNHLEETKDNTIGNSSSSQDNVQPAAPRPPINPAPGGAVVANGISREGASDGKTNQNTAANTAKSKVVSPTKAPILPSKAPSPTITSAETIHTKRNEKPNVPKNTVVSTTAPAADASKSKVVPFNANGNGAQTLSSSSLALAVAVPPLPPVKRKSSQASSANDSKAVLNVKKRKIDNTPTLPKPTSSGNESSTNIPVTLEKQKTPIPSFSNPPGPKVNGKKAIGEDDQTPKATLVAATAKLSSTPLATVNGSAAKNKNSKEDFVTIQIGSVEKNIEKKNDNDVGESSAVEDKKTENAAKASTSSASVTATSAVAATASTSTNKSALPPTSSSKSSTADEIVGQYTKFPLLKGPKDARPLRSLSTSERIELERLFEFDKRKNSGKTWDHDWFGVLDLCNIDVQNPDGQEGERHKKRSLLEWVGLNTKVGGDGKKKTSAKNNSLRLLNNLLRHVYNYTEVPEQAKLILANTNPKDPISIGDAIQRLSIDPVVLLQDGWTTTKSKEPQGASGGAYRIGEKIWWQGYLGVVLAFVHDDDIGDLWKAIWVEDLLTFDLEHEELEESRKRYERKKAVSTEKKKKQMIHKTIKYDLQVAGIEHGIVLATSYARGARHGVFWPARVLHASELVGITGRRSKNRKKVDVVFLAPYWNGDQTLSTGVARRAEPFSSAIATHGDLIFSSGPMFEVESIDANYGCIQSYPYDAGLGLDIDSLRSTFKFMGLPKAAFSRFLDSQRIALGFKTYSQTELKSTLASESDRMSAALLEGHPLAVQAPHFPSSVLQLPFVHILSQLPGHERQALSQSQNETTKGEPALRFNRILDAMKPPTCWGLEPSASSHLSNTPQLNSFITSPMTFLDKNKGTKNDPYNTGRFLTGLLSLQSLLTENSPTSRMLKNSLNELVSTFSKNSSMQNLQKSEYRKRYLKSLNRTWVVVKSKGETLILAALKHKTFLPFLKDWRRCCERIYKHINVDLGSNGKSWVITDSRCNLHLTSSECFERAVRLPAALKGVRQATGNIEIINTIEDAYLNLAEKDIIPRAHKMSYLQRIKKRCMAAAEDEVVALTDDSDGNGGEDTKGSKGTWNAALLGVGAALKGLDMIVNGECLNVFCATRPPGHHAGRELHAMKAVSNGFCILNSVACAALYAATPITDGGLGLSRVCVVDIDVHHGNGTQDILCSTYDPRFLYVSMHAGGPDINGLDMEDDELEQVEHHLGGNPKKGIFPGRCGDISPHKGVLNIPLGGRVTSHALGTALVTKVTPAVEAFNPEIVIISAGFDAHKNDPLNMGGLTAEDFGTLTEVICKLAYKCCSGRVLSVMEGGYGVPCCRPQNFADRATNNTTTPSSKGHAATKDSNKPKQPEQFVELQCLDLGSEIPPSMSDVISSYALQKRLDKCHQEGFIHCVKEHVSALARCNVVKR